MLFAASESAVTKNPRLRLTRRRSSSVSPSGFFHSSMSRLIWISWGIQWFAHAERYFSHAHLYLNGTSWLTSVAPLMMRLSATLTRRELDASTLVACGALAATADSAGETRGVLPSADGGRLCARLDVFDLEGLTSSSQTTTVGFLGVRI